jgi:DNA-binding NarL/FixJ family response regulator
MSATTRVAIIDAHPMFRVGIAQLLRSAGGCEIVGDGAGIEVCSASPASRLPT